MPEPPPLRVTRRGRRRGGQPRRAPGTPILLLHGLGGTGAYWERTMRAAGRPCAPDRARSARLRRVGRAARRIRPRHGEPIAWPRRSLRSAGRPRSSAATRWAARWPCASRCAIPAPSSRLILVGAERPRARAGLAAPRRPRSAALPRAAAHAVRVGALAARRSRRCAAPRSLPLVDSPANVDPAVMRSLLEGVRVARELPAAARRLARRGPRRGGARIVTAPDLGDLGRPRPHGARRRRRAARCARCPPRRSTSCPPAGTCR